VRIGAVTLDAGGTLIEPWPSVGHVYADEASRHGWPGLSPETLNRRFRRAWTERGEAFQHTEAEWASLVDRTFGEMVGVPASRSFFPQLYERFAQAEAWRVYPDVEPTLSALAEAGIPVGIISNWDSRLRPLLEALDLARRFKVIVVSWELGCRKPDERIFLEAARQLGLLPSEILHVGDDPQDDTWGAVRAGYLARTVVRSAQARSLGADEICSLLDLLDRGVVLRLPSAKRRARAGGGQGADRGVWEGMRG
jgi:putative hydrolase of the HAD superfamily